MRKQYGTFPLCRRCRKGKKSNYIEQASGKKWHALYNIVCPACWISYSQNREESNRTYKLVVEYNDWINDWVARPYCTVAANGVSVLKPSDYYKYCNITGLSGNLWEDGSDMKNSFVLSKTGKGLFFMPETR